MNNEMIKRVARAIDDCPHSRFAHDRIALVALSALTPADLTALVAEKLPGWKIVPVEITPAQYDKAGWAWMHRDPSDSSSEPIRDCYKAAVAAAPAPGGE